MKIQIPSEVNGRPSASAAVFWMKMPNWLGAGRGARERLLVDDALDEDGLAGAVAARRRERRAMDEPVVGRADRALHLADRLDLGHGDRERAGRRSAASRRCSTRSPARCRCPARRCRGDGDGRRGRAADASRPASGLVIAIPAAGGVTVALKLVTVPSGSLAVTTRVAAVPSSVDSAPPQVAVTGWFGGGPPQGASGDAVLRGAGAPDAKSAPFWSVSVQPFAARSAARRVAEGRGRAGALEVGRCGAVADEVLERGVREAVAGRSAARELGRVRDERDLAARRAHRDRAGGVRRGQVHGPARALRLLDEVVLARVRACRSAFVTCQAAARRGGVLHGPAGEADR